MINLSKKTIYKCLQVSTALTQLQISGFVWDKLINLLNLSQNDQLVKKLSICQKMINLSNDKFVKNDQFVPNNDQFVPNNSKRYAQTFSLISLPTLETYAQKCMPFLVTMPVEVYVVTTSVSYLPSYLFRWHHSVDLHTGHEWQPAIF